MSAAVSFFDEKNPAGSRLASLNQWVSDAAALTTPDDIHWCDGSDEEYDALLRQMQQTGTLLPLNAQTHPGSWLHRSDPGDVARVEHLTFVCSRDRDDAGPNNHWMPPAEGHNQMDALFAGCMRGRTLYVIPYCMGPIDSPLARCGVEITDSPYVVANMRIMTRMGAAALARLLASAGYKTESVGDAVSGLKRLEESPLFDAVIVDLFMPGLRGDRLVRVARQKYPKLALLVLSGVITERDCAGPHQVLV